MCFERIFRNVDKNIHQGIIYFIKKQPKFPMEALFNIFIYIKIYVHRNLLMWENVYKILQNEESIFI